ncbi:uncharacterized protein LOC142989459 [Genypterus blacodes]|uniref:uncharacterized protein LOC142989459 n=1 Tax=Genypterus blacodes TaxID=154954 RepID=UPI003F7619B3
MPGCKFQDSWLSKEIYKDWLLKDPQDIHFARCRVCCKSIKLQTMGEAALTSHAGGAGHKAALRKLLEGKLLVINVPEQVNGGYMKNEDSKEHVSLSLQPDAFDRGSEWSDPRHSPTANSHHAELQDAAFAGSYITSQGSSRIISPCHPAASGSEPEEASQRSARHNNATHLTKLQHKQRTEALEQQMKILEWENRMKMLAWEQELMKEKKRAARQKQKAFRMKKEYYKAKLKRMGEEAPPSSSSSSDEEEKPSSHAG